MRITESTITNDREGVIDAVLRMLEGLDFADDELLVSALTEDAVFDLSGIDSSIADFTPLEGRDAVVDGLMAGVGRNMDTFHTLTNVRTRIEGDRAELTAYVVGQHHRLGEGPSLHHQDHMLMGERYETDLVRDSGTSWRVRSVRASSRWSTRNRAAAGIV